MGRQEVKKRDVPLICQYQKLRGKFFNAGGALPCMQCKGCIADYESLERLKKWNRDTANGADPRR